MVTASSKIDYRKTEEKEKKKDKFPKKRRKKISGLGIWLIGKEKTEVERW